MECAGNAEPVRETFCTEKHRVPKNSFGWGLTNKENLVYLQMARGVVEPVGHHSRVEEASSQCRIKRRPEVHPIVRFFTSTG